MLLKSIAAVSYTHLDVYKRQMSWCAPPISRVSQIWVFDVFFMFILYLLLRQSIYYVAIKGSELMKLVVSMYCL